MINLCLALCKDSNIIFNIKKSLSTDVSKHRHVVHANLRQNSSTLLWVDKLKYLCIHFEAGGFQFVD